VNAVRVFTLADFVQLVRRGGRRIDMAEAAYLIDGPGGFCERGYVARVPSGFVVTAKGEAHSRSLQNMRWAA
jgi:hypothetical protein